jgi:hypothetical protein
MIKDIPFLKVEDVSIAVAPAESDMGIQIYKAYLINHKEQDLHHIMVRCSGMGLVNEEKIKTSTLRILLDVAPKGQAIAIDSFPQEAAGLYNEYWISFRYKGYLYDKKFVFVPESIVPQNFIHIPALEQKGVWIK